MPRAIVDVAGEIVPGVVRVVFPAVIPAACIAPDHAAGLLKPAVGIHELALTNPVPGMSLNVSASDSSQPGVTSVSLLRNTRKRPRAASAPGCTIR